MNTANPWKKLKSAEVYENAWIKVSHDDVIRPDGKPGVYGVVHYKNKAIAILPIDDAGNIHLVGQYRYVLDFYSWEIPEGGCPEGEDPLEAAKRELQEETGLTASNWTLMGQSHLSNSVSDEGAVWYLATGLTQGVAAPEGTEELAQKLVSLETALTMIEGGEIMDALSIIAIHGYALKKQRNS